MAGDPRSTARWRRVRLIVLAEQPYCSFCGLGFPPGAPPRSRWAPTVDHIVPLDRGGAPFDRANLRSAHYGCNSARGAGPVRPRRRRGYPAEPVERGERASWGFDV